MPDRDADETPAVDRPDLAPVLEDLERRLREADGLLFLSDFDGTLAPIVEDPAAAAPLDGVPEIVRTLRDAEQVAVGLVSGRALADLRERAGVSDVHYAGNHGLELQEPPESENDPEPDVEVHPDAADAADAVGEVAADAAARLEDVDGVKIEDKRVTATVHYRSVADEDVPAVKRAVREAVDDAEPELRITSGKAILEIRPDVDWDKGAAVEWLRDRLVPDGERWTELYVGDDVTDEDAFAALENGPGIAVGETTEAAADHRIDDPEAVRALVRWIAGPGLEHLAAEPNEAD